MHKIHEQQDHVATGINTRISNTRISRATGEQDTGIRSQSELEARMDELLAQNEVLARECRQEEAQFEDALENINKKEETIKEMTEQLRQAAEVIDALQKERLRLKGELCDYLEQVVRNQQHTINELNAQLGNSLGNGS